jgi:hypothetical protein
MDWAYRTHGRDRNAYNNFVVKPERRKPLERPKCRWEGDVRMDLLSRVGRCGLDSSGSEWEPVTGSYEYCNELSGSIK